MEDTTLGREERLQLIKLVASLIIFVFALHVLCSRDAQIALARAHKAGTQAASAAPLQDRAAASAVEAIRSRPAIPLAVNASIISE
ncbi:MAG: hypothetical protein ABSG46_12475 [Candidatus Binataceae bacterium]|jgi:hypothetical protein